MQTSSSVVFWYTGLSKLMLLMLFSRQFLQTKKVPKPSRMSSAGGQSPLPQSLAGGPPCPPPWVPGDAFPSLVFREGGANPGVLRARLQGTLIYISSQFTAAKSRDLHLKRFWLGN